MNRVERFAARTPGSPPGGTTFLLIGADSRAFVAPQDRHTFGTPQQSPGDHADLILLIRVQDGGGVSVLPIPRDLVVQLDSGAPVRITLTLALGPQGPVDSLCRNLGIGVDHVVVMHFDGLAKVVDEVGGIYVTIPAPVRDPMADLMIAHAGVNHLDGAQALALVRARNIQHLDHGQWLDDPPLVDERSDHAVQVLSALASRIRISAGSPITTLSELWTFAGTVQVDDALTLRTSLRLLRALHRLGQSDEIRLDVVFHPGVIPTADLGPGAGKQLAGFDHGPVAGCRFRPLPVPQSG